MKSSHRLPYALSGIVLLALLLLTACGSQPSTANRPTPTPTTPPAPTPTPTMLPTPTPTPIAGTLLGGNLIVNGNAEQGKCATDTNTVITPIPGWTPTSEITPIQYAASGGDLSSTTPGPSDAGNCYFWGGPDGASSSMTQTINLTADAAAIDSNTVVYDLSAWLGGYADQNDNAVVTIQFLGATGSALGSAKIGPVLAADRNDTTELVERSTSGPVPSGTRAVTVTLTFTRTDGTNNDGLADDLALLFYQQGGATTPTPTPTATPTPA